MNPSELDVIDEQLTAYLDGELTPQEATALEQSLVGDEKLRVRLAELRKAYDLLDEIPETPHNQRFTKSTMELVIKDITRESQSSTVIPRATVERRDPLTWPRSIFLFCAMLMVGILGAWLWTAMHERNELKNLSLYAGIRGLQDVNHLESAIRLSKEVEVMSVLKERFSEEVGDEVLPPPPNSLGERKEWVEGLTPIQISRLKSGREMLNKMDRNERDRWAAMQSKIESRPESMQIQEACYLIGMVMDLKPRARDELGNMSQEERTVYLRNELCYYAALHYAKHMPAADIAALHEWDKRTLNPALIQENPSRIQDPMSRFNETRMLLALLVMRPRVSPFERQDELVDDLLPTLTKAGGKILEGITKNEDQLRVLYFWLVPDRVRSDQMLLDAYESLDKNARSVKESREKIDLDDPTKFRENLREAMPGPIRRP